MGMCRFAAMLWDAAEAGMHACMHAYIQLSVLAICKAAALLVDASEVVLWLMAVLMLA